MADISQITIGGTTYNIKDTTARQSSGGGTAASTTYDNSDSDLQATNVQDAIDELDALIYNAGNYETVSLTIGSVDSTFSPVGQTITVTLEDGSSTDYVLTNSLVISFSVQKGIKYTISGTSTADFRVLPISFKASIPTRYLTMRYIPIATGVFILQKDGTMYLKEEYDAETMAEDAVGVLVLTSTLIDAGYGIVLNPVAEHGAYKAGKQVAGIPFTSQTGWNTVLNGLGYTEISAAAQDNNVGDWAISHTLYTLQGYIGTVAEWALIKANVAEVNTCLLLLGGTTLLDFAQYGVIINSQQGDPNNGVPNASGTKGYNGGNITHRPFYYYPLS